jgi:cation transport regulator ChaC
VSSLRDLLWYFSYGSNMSRAILIGRRGLHPRASCVGWLEDYRLHFNLPVGSGERGVANLEPAPGTRTCGVLHLLAAEECDRLDRTEGVHMGVYRRVPVAVHVLGEEVVVEAFTYRSSRSVVGRKPSPRYMQLLLDGAAEHGLPGDWVRFLESFELAVDEREASPERPPEGAH